MRPKTDFNCADCRLSFKDATYASLSDGSKVCDDCSHEMEAKAIRNGDRYSVYGPSELKRGAKITTWPGRMLGRIVSVGSAPHVFTRRSFWGEKYYCEIRMLDGSLWSGWIGEGIISNVKRSKVFK